MSGYELRAQHRPADPLEGGEHVRWHVVRQGSATALCGRYFPLVGDVRPVTEVHAVTPACRCGECWDRLAALEEVWAEGSPREPDP
ncbi:hypothetical protein [Streptacidiphilus anmyonensis]|uniref:hypothetical protein n=1 Tax=Streptacidiphilus anmyonensis TaxID=405782 RepID=UPI0005A9506D|nr:hypothetical protein [Streptacidiphilus anmyonensis]